MSVQITEHIEHILWNKQTYFPFKPSYSKEGNIGQLHSCIRKKSNNSFPSYQLVVHATEKCVIKIEK